MSNKTEGTFAIIAALLVLFSAMLDPRVSIILAMAGLVLFSLSRSKFQAEAAPTPPESRAWEPAPLTKLDLLSLYKFTAAKK